jgi:hypothetical protein
MGLIDEKRNIFNTIAAYKSMESGVELPNPTDSISSINNRSKDPSRFLVDLLVTLVGSAGLVQSLGELMTVFIRNVNNDLKSELKKQIVMFNSDQTLSSTSFSGGYELPISSIDVYEKLKTDPSSDVGNLIYSNNANNLDQKLYNSIVADGETVNYNSQLDLVYNNGSDTITITPSNTSLSIGNFLESYIDDLTLINENEFTSDIINLLYGTISANQDKNLQNAVTEEKLKIVIEKLINETEDLSFTPDELRLVEQKAREKSEGFDLVDVGCSNRISNIDINQLQTLVNSNTGNTNPYGVGLNYLSLLDNSFNSNDVPAQKNITTITDSFLKQLINAILQNLIRVSALTPEPRILFAMVNGLKNNGATNIGDPFNDIDSNRNFYDCVVKNSKSLISEYLFNLVKKELMKLVVIISKVVLKEKYDAYIRIIRSLFRVFNTVSGLVS